MDKPPKAIASTPPRRDWRSGLDSRGYGKETMSDEAAKDLTNDEVAAVDLLATRTYVTYSIATLLSGLGRVAQSTSISCSRRIEHSPAAGGKKPLRTHRGKLRLDA